MSDPVDLLRSIYPSLANGQRDALVKAVDAVKALQAQVSEQAGLIGHLQSQVASLAEAAESHWPEAPASANVRVVEPSSQMEWLLTFRALPGGDGLTAYLVGQLPAIGQQLQAAGFVAFDAYVDGRRAEREAARAETPAAPPAHRPVPAALPPTAPAGGGVLTFAADTMEATTNKGKVYWKVKGGKFSRFGVAIWPEVLQASGFDPDQLHPDEVYNLAGYTATYCLNDEGKADKVTTLSRA